VRRSLPGINYALAEAVRDVAALYGQLPDTVRPDVSGERWQALEADLDRLCGTGDRDGALLAIEEWRDTTKALLSTTLLHAPLEDRG
jgi:hypothetical protein